MCGVELLTEGEVYRIRCVREFNNNLRIGSVCRMSCCVSLCRPDNPEERQLSRSWAQRIPSRARFLQGKLCIMGITLHLQLCGSLLQRSSYCRSRDCSIANPYVSSQLPSPTMVPRPRPAFSWTGDPSTYPLIGAITVGVSLLLYITTRKLAHDPTVLLNR